MADKALSYAEETSLKYDPEKVAAALVLAFRAVE